MYNVHLAYLSLLTGDGRGRHGGEGDLDSRDLFLWLSGWFWEGRLCSLGELDSLLVDFLLLLTSLEMTEWVVLFIIRNSAVAILGARKLRLCSSNISASSINWMASFWSVGGVIEEAEGRRVFWLTPSLLLLPPSSLSRSLLLSLSITIGLSSGLSSFLPQFSLALSGGMPVPPLSMDQGALPAGQGYSCNSPYRPTADL